MDLDEESDHGTGENIFTCTQLDINSFRILRHNQKMMVEYLQQVEDNPRTKKLRTQ